MPVLRIQFAQNSDTFQSVPLPSGSPLKPCNFRKERHTCATLLSRAGPADLLRGFVFFPHLGPIANSYDLIMSRATL